MEEKKIKYSTIQLCQTSGFHCGSFFNFVYKANDHNEISR